MFDIIIIGGGSAGCTLAANLDSHLTICLLEAGGSDLKPQVTIPLGMAITVPYPSAHNWRFFTSPQKHMNNRRGYQPRGRGLGGSSSINAMIYIRGQAEDYNNWAANGCTGWAWNDVLPYFIKTEKNYDIQNQYHGSDKGIGVSDSKSNNIFARAFIDAGIEAGYTYNADFNGKTQEGVGWYQLTQVNGERCNAARAFLHDKPMPNLTIMTKTHVKRILFETTNGIKKAVGVEIIRGGEVEIIIANKEIVLCGGTFASPQILLASGIGNKEHLTKLNIPVVHDLPEVGQNLHDHIDFIINKKVPFPVAMNLAGISLRGVWHYISEFKKYLTKRRGLFTSNVAESGAFLKSNPEARSPDIQLHFMVAMMQNHHIMYRYMHGYSCHVCVLRPKSRGSVYLSSPDTTIPPVIDPNFLSDPEDMATLVRGVKTMYKILGQQALTKFGGKMVHPATDPKSDEEIINLIRQHADTVYHPVGTCRMGSDSSAVVSTELLVNGIRNLRVADASVMPSIISGNTNAATIMIAARAAEFINKLWMN